MTIFPMLRAVSMVAACVFAAGCATASPVKKLYAGPDRPDAEVSSLIVPYTINIKGINGQPPPVAIGSQSQKEQEIKLLPGPYQFSAWFSSPFEFGAERGGVSTACTDHKAVLEAGHTYRFMSRVKGYDSNADVDIWIEDIATHVRVDEMPRASLPKPVAAEPAPAPKTETVAPAIEAENPHSTTLDDLKRSWHAATPDERAEFLKSITSP